MRHECVELWRDDKCRREVNGVKRSQCRWREREGDACDIGIEFHELEPGQNEPHLGVVAWLGNARHGAADLHLGDAARQPARPIGEKAAECLLLRLSQDELHDGGGLEEYGAAIAYHRSSSRISCRTWLSGSPPRVASGFGMSRHSRLAGAIRPSAIISSMSDVGRFSSGVSLAATTMCGLALVAAT